MNFIWEPKDCVAGVRFVRATELHTDRVSQIGWLASQTDQTTHHHPLVVIDHCDGMVSGVETAEEIAASLTEAGAYPIEIAEAIRSGRKAKPV